MGFALAVFATALVLFFIFAMAMAEWADKDPGELLAWLGKRKTVPPPAAITAEPAAVLPPVRKPTVSKSRTAVQGKKGKSKTPGASAAGKNTAVKKPAASKRKPR